MKGLLLLAAASLVASGCATAEPPAAPPAPPPGNAGEAAPTAAPAAAETGPGPATAPATGPELPAPASLAEGDRWFVGVKASFGTEPFALLSRRHREGGFVREEITWGKSFSAVASAKHGIEQVSALILDARGLCAALVDETGGIRGEPGIEVAAPFRPGNRWAGRVPNGYLGSVEALEDVETPGGRVKSLRVRVWDDRSEGLSMTTWYDEGLRPVRMEIRSAGVPGVVEARAALASASPTPEECRAAVEWAKRVFPAEAR